MSTTVSNLVTKKQQLTATTSKFGLISKPGISPEGFEYIIEYEYIYDDDDLIIKDPNNLSA